MTDSVHDLVAPYVLDALDALERDAFEAHLRTCATCRQEVEALGPVTADLAVAEWAEPPAHLRAAVLDAIEHVPQAEPLAASSRSGRWLRPQMITGFVAAAAVVVAVVLGVRVVQLGDEVDRAREVEQVLAAPDGRLVDLEAPQGVTARFAFSAARGQGVFLADGLADVPDDLTYELWIIDAAGPVPAGLFRPSDGMVTFPVAADLGAAEALGVTVEPAGGSPQPTGDILIVGGLRS